MKPQGLAVASFVVKLVSSAVCFVFFVVIVKPEISAHVIPKLVDLSDSYANAQNGVDLDPIFLSEGGSFASRITGLYSTRHGYVGNGIYGDLITSDTRVIAMNRFLVDYDSPMAPYAETFIASADDAGLDWRLVASISGVESAFGRLIPHNSYNAWGWRGGPGGAFSNFSSWPDAISYVTAHIADGYGTSLNVYGMEPIYCPPCGQNPQHAWAGGVTRYIGELDEYRRNL